MRLVSCLPVQEILLWSVCNCCQGVVYQSVRISHFFFMLPESFEIC